MLNQAQIDEFRKTGFVVVPEVVSTGTVDHLLARLDEWVEESRSHTANFDTDTPDGKARFDLEDGHTAKHPRLRRIANPCDVSERYANVLFEGAIPTAVSDLIGPDVKFHHCKLNNKFPGTNTRVEYHQDHPYDPHTNDDGITMLLLLDDMTEENGCLRIVPGSQHDRPTHFRDGVFVGTTDPAHYEDYDARALPVLGKAGDVCLMDIWALHGGGPNLSNGPRRVLITDYRAADAYPLTGPAIHSRHYQRIVAGKPTHIARFREGTMEILQPYEDDSFFGLLGQKAAS